MKKIILLSVMAIMGLTLSAQKKGDMYVSGSFSISGGTESGMAKTGNTKINASEPLPFSFSFAPAFGYFIMDNLEVNASLGYKINRSAPNGNSTADRNYYNFSHEFVISPGAKYYFPIVDGKFFYTPGAALSIGFDASSSRVNDNTVTKDPAGFIFGLGLDLVSFEFRPAEHIGVIFSAGSFGWSLKSSTDKNTAGGVETKTVSTTNTVNFGLNTGATIGFKYYF